MQYARLKFFKKKWNTLEPCFFIYSVWCGNTTVTNFATPSAFIGSTSSTSIPLFSICSLSAAWWTIARYAEYNAQDNGEINGRIFDALSVWKILMSKSPPNIVHISLNLALFAASFVAASKLIYVSHVEMPLAGAREITASQSCSTATI